jgi:hypothetical protein
MPAEEEPPRGTRLSSPNAAATDRTCSYPVSYDLCAGHLPAEGQAVALSY